MKCDRNRHIFESRTIYMIMTWSQFHVCFNECDVWVWRIVSSWNYLCVDVITQLTFESIIPTVHIRAWLLGWNWSWIEIDLTWLQIITCKAWTPWLTCKLLCLEIVFLLPLAGAPCWDWFLSLCLKDTPANEDRMCEFSTWLTQRRIAESRQSRISARLLLGFYSYPRSSSVAPSHDSPVQQYFETKPSLNKTPLTTLPQ